MQPMSQPRFHQGQVSINPNVPPPVSVGLVSTPQQPPLASSQYITPPIFSSCDTLLNSQHCLPANYSGLAQPSTQQWPNVDVCGSQFIASTRLQGVASLQNESAAGPFLTGGHFDLNSSQFSEGNSELSAEMSQRQSDIEWIKTYEGTHGSKTCPSSVQRRDLTASISLSIEHRTC